MMSAPNPDCPCERSPSVCVAMVAAIETAARVLCDDETFRALIEERRNAGITFG